MTTTQRGRFLHKVRMAVLEPLKHTQEMYRRKSAPVAFQKRMEADRALSSNNPQKALMLYSQSCMRAPGTGEYWQHFQDLYRDQLSSNNPPGTGVDKTVDQGLSLALALGGRSEALLVLEDYLQSLADTNLAVKEGFPQHLRYQLYWRMGRCYRGLNQVAKARVSLQLSARLVREHLAQLGNEAVISLMRLQEELADLVLLEEEGSSNELLQIKQPDETPLPPVVAGCHPELGCASRLLGVSRTEQAGRYVVAREPVATGDTLVVEPAYAACLLPDKFGSHCHHCFARLNAPVACPECSGLAFCSVRCRDEACRSYHRYECHYMDLLIGSGMSILCHVALRMVTQAGEQFFLDRRQDLTSHSKEILPPSDKYLAVHNLVTHANKRKPKEFFQRTLMAVFLLKCLQKAGYFSAPSIDQTCLSEEELLIGSLLLRHLQLLQFNAHEVYETRIEAPRQLRTSKTEYIGVAIYPTVALFNHDCYPAVTRYFVGHSIVVRATRPLGTGDIVAENYGPVFTKRSLESRQRALTSRYWFRCICQACKENWPALDMVDNNDFRLWSIQWSYPLAPLHATFYFCFGSAWILGHPKTMVGGLEPPQAPAWVRYCCSQNKLDTADDGEIGVQIIVGYNGYGFSLHGVQLLDVKKLLAMPGNKSNRSTAKQGVKCPACKKHVRHDEALATLVNCEAWFKEGIESMEVGDVDVAIRLFCSYLDSMHSIGFPPHKDILLCQEALRICMAGSGNVWVTGKIDASSK
uniref:SET and MYND domain-containing protein 4 n=1 Tax=Timema cristinae TaxID=61476 RepID=A0A7R9CAM6_TIMCR|nr:unnamed protein product [Timema cristinae]